MTTFAEVRIEDGLVIYNTEGGPEFSTTIVVVNSGAEFRNARWTDGLGKWDFGDRKLQDTELSSIVGFFRARNGKAQGFRVKDWGDYQATAVVTAYKNSSSQGFLGTAGVGNGTPTLPIYKAYISGADTMSRRIWKPVANTVIPYRNGSQVVIGAGAGQCSIDTVGGNVVMVADASSLCSSVVVGATTQVTLAANPGTLVAGKLLYCSGMSGADAALLNNQAFSINSVSGAGPFIFTLAVNTAGKTITGGGAAAGAKYPQVSDVMTATFEFDLPARFDTDAMKYRFDSAGVVTPGTNSTPAVLGTKIFYLSTLPIVELRNP